jgi:hypothetical protein
VRTRSQSWEIFSWSSSVEARTNLGCGVMIDAREESGAAAGGWRLAAYLFP